jgi:hypothetical protein
VRRVSRRQFLARAAATAAAGLAGCGGGGSNRAGTPAPGLPPPPALGIEDLLSDTQQRTFNFFWQTTDAVRGLAPDFSPGTPPASIAAMGFALTAIPVGIEHGWITRAQGVERALNTLSFLRDAPQGGAAQGMSGFHGFFYHFLDMSSGTRYGNSELSSIDTALLLMGARSCGQYFTGSDASESSIRSITDLLCERVEWRWFQNGTAGISLGWRPETGFMSTNWRGYNEAIPIFLLALGSTANAVGPAAWADWTSTYPQSWGTLQGIEHLTFGPLFGHQYTQVWVDMRGIRDAYMSAKGLDYFENSRRAVLSQQSYGTSNPLGWQGYAQDCWGLSACDGPADALLIYNGRLRRFHTYAGRGVGLESSDDYDDGTLTPTAPIGSLPFAPDLAKPAIAAMYRKYGAAIYGEYGFLDSFNPSFQFNVALQSGRLVNGLGWVDTRYYGINQGPIIAMIENLRSGLFWNLSRTDPVLRKGLQAAGFTGGWLG